MSYTNCPNIKHPDWDAYVKKVGFISAYRFFVNNGYQTPIIPPFKSIEDVNDHLKTIKELSRVKGIWYVKYNGSINLERKNKERIDSEIERINKLYEGNLLSLQTYHIDKPKAGRTFGYYVEIHPEILKEFYNGFKTLNQEANIHIDDEGNILPIYEQRKGWYDDLDTYKDFRLKKDWFGKFFPEFQILEDTKLNIPGKVDMKEKVITLNPNMVTKDSIGHEFGHILLYSLGGMSNPLIKKAREQLINSDVEKFVREKYPELENTDANKFDIEIVATSLGVELTTLFETESQRSDWRNWLSHFFNLIKQKLGLNENAVVEISKKLANNNWAKNKTEKEQLDVEFKEFEAKEETSVYKQLRNEALANLRSKRAIIGRKGLDSKTLELDKLITKINRLDTDPIEALRLFSMFVHEQTDNIYLEYLSAKQKQSEGGNGFTLRKLSKWNNYISGLDLISEFVTAIEEASVDREDPKLAERVEKEINLEELREDVAKHNQIKQAYLEQGTNLIAKFLSKYSNHISARYQEAFEKDYNKLSDEDKKNITKEQYIKEQSNLNADKIDRYTERNIKAELQKASDDINVMQRWVENLLDSSDVVVSSMVNAFTNTARDSRIEQIEIKEKMVELLRELESFQKDKQSFFKSDREFYDFMLEHDDEGKPTGYITDVFKSTIYEDLAKKRNKLSAGRRTYNNIQQELYQWRNKNAPMSKESKVRFQTDRDAFVQKLYDDHKINNEELANIKKYFKIPFSFELHERINDDAATAISKWLRANSWKYRTPIKKYQSKDWINLVKIAGGDESMSVEDQIKAVRNSDDPRLKFFNFIKDTNDNIQDALPYIHRIYDHLPGAIKKGSESIREGDIKGGIGQVLSDTFNMTRDEGVGRGEIKREITKETGEPMLFIPVYYTRRLSSDEQSYDLADAYLKYFQSAIDYKHKSQILPEMEMTRYLINNRQVLSKDDSGRTMVDAIKKKALTKSGATSLIAAQFNDWMDAVVYDVKTKDQGTVGKTNIDTAKFLDSLGRYTSLSLLAGNMVQGVSNVTLGSAMQWIESFGGEFYKPKDYLKAKLLYSKHLGGIVGDIGSRKPTDLISVLNREFDTLNEYTGGNMRRNSKFSQLMSSDTLFFTSHAGEHWMQSKVMLAMLNNLKAKDTSGKVIGNMLDKISVKDGKMIVDVEVANFGKDEQRIFEGTLKRVLSSLHGEYSELGRVALQRGAIGRLVYMFRKFIMTGVKRRYGKRRVNNITGKVVEGNYRTFGKFFSRLIKDMRGFQFALMSEDWKKLTNMEKANIRRTIGELSFLLATFILISLKFNNDDDDEPDNPWMYSFLGYQAYRFRAELSFFLNPSETLKILRSPMASMSAIENMIKLTGQLMDPIWNGDLQFERYERGNWKGTPKIKKTMINLIPAYKQIYRLKYIDDQISWLNN